MPPRYSQPLQLVPSKLRCETALSTIVTVASRGPLPLGVKVKEMVQLLVGPVVARVVPRQVSASWKSAEVGWPTLLMFSGRPPLFVKVTVWEGLAWPIVTPPKTTDVELRVAFAPKPFPLNDTT